VRGCVCVGACTFAYLCVCMCDMCVQQVCAWLCMRGCVRLCVPVCVCVICVYSKYVRGCVCVGACAFAYLCVCMCGVCSCLELRSRSVGILYYNATCLHPSFIPISSQIHSDFILILSQFHPRFISVSSQLHSNFISPLKTLHLWFSSAKQVGATDRLAPPPWKNRHLSFRAQQPYDYHWP